MPWIKNDTKEIISDPEKFDTNDISFVVSHYAINELPTWSEMFYLFYIQNLYRYDPEIHKDKDLYFKVPKALYMIAFACNQLNKLTHESNTESVNNIYKKLENISNNIKDIRFSLNMHDKSQVRFDIYPIVYHFKLPTNQVNFYMGATHPSTIRMMINDYSNPVDIQVNILTTDNQIISFSYTDKPEEFESVINAVMNNIIEYFREYPGWK